jgi:hypothetical protein
MSVTVAQSVTLPQKDQEAINAFKACFGIKADPIRGAYEEVVRLTGDIEANKKEQAQITALRDTAKKTHTTLYSKRQDVLTSKGKLPAANQKETDAEETMNDCDAKLKDLQQKLQVFEGNLKDAEIRKEIDPWSEYLKQLKSLKQRIADAGQKESAIKADTWDGPIKPFDTGKFKEFEKAVRKQSDDVEALCMPIERENKRKDVETRLVKLQELEYKDAKRIGTIREDAKAAELPKLNGEIETLLTTLEDDCTGFPRRLEEAGKAIEALRMDALLPVKDTDDADKTLQELTKAARKALDDDRLAEMEALEERIDQLQTKSETAADDFDRYNQEAQEAEQDFAEFLGRSGSHKAYKQGLDNKVHPALENGKLQADQRNFVAAANYVADARANLDDWDTKAWATETKQGQIKLAQQQDLQKKKQVAQAKKDLEDAKKRNDIAALNLVGKKKFGEWIGKVGNLYVAGLVDVDATDPVGLNKSTETVEIVVTLSKVNAGDPALDDDSFVVHYHSKKMKADPTQTKKEAQAAIAKNTSSMHTKPDKSSNYRASVSEWLTPLVPTVRGIKDMIEAKTLRLV